MEENNQNENVQENSNDLKNETINTVNEVKDTIKKVNIKRDAIETKGFAKEIFTNPIGKIKEIAQDNSSKYLKYAIIILAIWLIAILISTIFNMIDLWRWIRFKDILSCIKSLVAPILNVLALSIIIQLFTKKEKKKMTTTIATVTSAKILSPIAEIFGLTVLISSDMVKLTRPFSAICTAITSVLTYFAAKEIIGEKDDSKFVKTFVVIEACFYLVYFAFTFLGIYI